MLPYLSSGGTFPPSSRKLLALSFDEFLCTLHWMTAKAQKRLEIEAESHYEFHKAWIESTFFCESMATTRYLVTAQCWKEILLGSRFDLTCGCGCWWTCRLEKNLTLLSGGYLLLLSNSVLVFPSPLHGSTVVCRIRLCLKLYCFCNTIIWNPILGSRP